VVIPSRWVVVFSSVSGVREKDKEAGVGDLGIIISSGFGSKWGAVVDESACPRFLSKGNGRIALPKLGGSDRVIVSFPSRKAGPPCARRTARAARRPKNCWIGGKTRRPASTRTIQSRHPPGNSLIMLYDPQSPQWGAGREARRPPRLVAVLSAEGRNGDQSVGFRVL